MSRMKPAVHGGCLIKGTHRRICADARFQKEMRGVGGEGPGIVERNAGGGSRTKSGDSENESEKPEMSVMWQRSVVVV